MKLWLKGHQKHRKMTEWMLQATNDPKNIEITICVEIVYLCEYFFISDKPSWQWTPRTLASLIKLLMSHYWSAPANQRPVLSPSDQSEASIYEKRAGDTLGLSETSPSRPLPGCLYTTQIPVRHSSRQNVWKCLQHQHHLYHFWWWLKPQSPSGWRWRVFN